ncbi:MAG: asparagine synthase (glutamine-hydrolyzing) [Planctomycetota bacterium]|nr:MAG: asparagine synthase (glutamine-hydrolyzing) [Planctomycetota bacterium]
MCGICGLTTAGDADHAAVVTRMNAAIVHRGPDDAGSYTDATTSLAMRRLSIIDRAGGHQPIVNEDGTLVIVFNGEIYNYRELREELLRSGRHIFRTQSDTEVILHAFEEFGERVPERLEGMFAFCIYRTTDGSLFFARDRFGEKPLFYWHGDGRTLAFSSELTSLLEWEAIPRQADLDALHVYLRRAFVPSPWTTFAGVRQLPPGHTMTWRNGVATVRRYFALQPREDAAFEDERAAKEAVRGALLSAVKRQMESEVPLGAFLSGGIDSSGVVAAMQRQSSRPVKTFTVRFAQADYDESPVARCVAEHLGTEHREFFVPNNAFDAEDLWRVVRHVGMPFADSSAIPTFYISRLIRDHVTVCLSGDGGDEMFAGYQTFRWTQQLDRLAIAPGFALAALENVFAAASRFPGLGGSSAVRKARRAVHFARGSANERVWSIGEMFSRDEMDSLLADEHHAARRRLADDWLNAQVAALDGMSRLRQMMAFRQQLSLPEDMLIKVDRMSMANSIEVRAPLLDVGIANLAARLPDKHLIRGDVKKYILREAIREWLPDEVFSHAKMGFGIPLHAFVNRQYVELCEDLLLGDRDGLTAQLFRRAALESFVRRGLDRISDRADLSVYRASHQLWALLQLAAWAKAFRVTL